VDWVHVAQDSDQWMALVNLRDPQNVLMRDWRLRGVG
jgi:hypothetical protein